MECLKGVVVPMAAGVLVLLVAAGSLRAQQYVVDPATIALWHMDTCSTTAVADATGVHNGTMGGTPTCPAATAPSWTAVAAPVLGNSCALAFNGMSDAVCVPHAPALNLTGSMGFTIEAWISWAGPSGNDHDMIVAKRLSGPTQHGYCFGITPAGELRIWDHGGGWTVNTVISAAGVVPTNQFVHVAVAYDATTGMISLYRGCQVVYSALAPSGQITANTGDLRIGTDGIPGFYFAGTIDEVRISSIARTGMVCAPSTCSYTITQPLGAGSLSLDISGCPPGGTYLAPLTLVGGAWPTGWLFGVDITISDLVAEMAFGPPFFGVLDATGGASFALPPGVGVLPAGLSIFSGGGVFSLGGGGLITTLPPVMIVTM